MYDLILQLGLPYWLQVTLLTIVVLATIVVALVTFVRTGRISKVLSIKEDNMKYRTSNYQDSKGYKPVSQAFTRKEKQYRLTTQGKLVELPDELDIQAQVDSHKDVDLMTSIERLMPKDMAQYDDNVFDVYSYNQDFLDCAFEAEEYKREVCARYGFDNTLSLKEVGELLQKRNEALVASINNAKVKEDTDNVEKDVEKKES